MLEIRVITKLPEAEQAWRALSPQETIFDDWDFRYAFYKFEPYPLEFYAAYEVINKQQETLVGLMPLQINSEHGREFFSEPDCEENRPFIKKGYEQIIPDLYAAINGSTKCYDITGSDDFTTTLPLEDYVYILPLGDLNDFNDFLSQRLSAKKKRNIRQEMHAVEKLNPEIIWNNFSDLGALFSLNIEKFKEESYLDAKGQRGWLELLNLPFNFHFLVIKIKNKIVAASLSIFYKQTYYYLINGASAEYPNVSKYLNKVNIEKAISLGASLFDAGLGDCNWKAAWHFNSVPQYFFKK